MLYPDSTHDTADSDALKLRPMVSRATFTMVVSSADIETPIDVTTSALVPLVIATVALNVPADGLVPMPGRSRQRNASRVTRSRPLAFVLKDLVKCLVSRYSRHMDELDPELLDRVRDAQAKLRAAEHDLSVANATFATALRQLNLAGGSVRDIARAVGLSHQRVAQLIDAVSDGRGWKRSGKKPIVLSCSFCGRTQNEAGKLIAGQGVMICDSCVAIAGPVTRTAAADPPFVIGAESQCSFCTKWPRPDLLVATDRTFSICGECLDLCDEIIDEELGRT
jgi:hypothetical protein